MLSCTQRRVIKIKNSPIIIRHDSTTQGHVCVRFSVFFSCAFFRCPYTGRPTTSSRRAATTTTTHSRGYTHFHKIKKANECCHTQTRRHTLICSNPPTQTQSSVKKKSLTHTHRQVHTNTRTDTHTHLHIRTREAVDFLLLWIFRLNLFD